MNPLLPRLRDRRGIALPVALVGLVAVSLLVTTALLTSTTESAISSAQTSAVRSLYSAENGVLTFLQQNAGAVIGTAPQIVTIPETGQRVRVTTALLRVADLGHNGFERTYALTAEPLQGSTNNPVGRAVIAMIQQRRPPSAPLSTNITSAVTLGGDLNVNGNAFTINGRDTGCGATGVEAVRSASNSQITANNPNHMDNFLGTNDAGQNTQGMSAIERSELSRRQLARNVLGGKTLEEVIASVPLHKRWGPRWSRPAWDGTLALDSAGNPEEVAVVDANRQVVDVEGGTGVLIIMNGNMRMDGNARFTGIIIVEGNFSLAGNPQIDGALVSLAMNGNNEIVQDESAVANGSITVQYDKCAIDAAAQAFGNVTGSQPAGYSSPMFAWSEIVR